jgi:hypothetical protein
LAFATKQTVRESKKFKKDRLKRERNRAGDEERKKGIEGDGR